MKAKEWQEARKRLIEEYQAHGITSCEGFQLNPKCMRTFMLSLHHLDKRSSLRAKNTFEETRLLCAECHYRADQAPGHVAFNDKLRSLR